jgi:FkbM family methyltransferase
MTVVPLMRIRRTVINSIKGFLRRRGLADRTPFKGFLRDARGVIHVGAHVGQERERYAQYRLNVLWVEPLPEHFAILERNIAAFPRQRAIQCLVTDKDDAEYAFHVTSNAGGSSSILPLDMHKDIWPDVTTTRTITLPSKTLPTALREGGVDAAAYDVLVMDTQGSELLVLMGAAPLLHGFRYIKAEVADFEAYTGCCQLAQVEAYLASHGFREHARNVIAQHPGGGRYFDIVFKRTDP